MICPHCSRNLLQKERTGQKCTHCKREFVFDPKTNPLALHDIRVRTVAGKLSGPEKAQFTTAQLWYAAARKTVTAPYKPLEGFGCLVFLLGVAIAVGTAFALDWTSGAVAGAVVVAVLVMVVGYTLTNTVVRPRMRREHRVSVPMPYQVFARQIVQTWPRLHRRPLPNLVPDTPPPVPGPELPRGVIVCPDQSVAACLLANGLPQRHGFLVVRSARDVPPNLPAILLHDASVDGLRFAAAASVALHPAPVVDAGLLPRHVLGNEKVLRLRGPDASPVGLGLTEAEAQWMAEGWWAPLAAVPPKKLLAVVERAVGRLDPAQRDAAAVGFLTWPGAARGE